MTNTADCSTNGVKQQSLDIRALRLAVFREWEKLWAAAMDPSFTGEIAVRVCVKAGRPGLPRFTREQIGVTQ